MEPGTGLWWALRPVWIATYLAGLALLALIFGRFGRGGGGIAVPGWRQAFGATLMGFGLALLALDGIGAEGPLGLRPWVVALPFGGALLVGFNPGRTARAKT